MSAFENAGCGYGEGAFRPHRFQAEEPLANVLHQGVRFELVAKFREVNASCLAAHVAARAVWEQIDDFGE